MSLRPSGLEAAATGAGGGALNRGADDLAAVMDAARVELAVLLAMGSAYAAADMFAAREPDRVDGLVLAPPWAVGIGAVQDASPI
jgi:pimeloyl-ACP methyl ester carboxylesterase